MKSWRHYSGFRFACTSLKDRLAGGLVCALFALACQHEPDPRSVRGALDAAATAVAARDGKRLFRIVDQRARHALESIVKDRHEAARLIRTDYPEAERAAALGALGDAASVTTSADLFALRCAQACMSELAQRIAAPVSEAQMGVELVVRTARGASLRLYHGDDRWWGLVWNTDALSHERDQAAQDLLQIRTNAEVYQKRRALEAQAPSTRPR